jgi:hypothetical protein
VVRSTEKDGGGGGEREMRARERPAIGAAAGETRREGNEQVRDEWDCGRRPCVTDWGQNGKLRKFYNVANFVHQNL